jgi:hypothetical protein
MERIRTHSHTNVSRIKSYCRNRRQENTTSISDKQQKVCRLITANTLEFHKKVQTLQKKLIAVKEHVKQTKNRLNFLHQYLD